MNFKIIVPTVTAFLVLVFLGILFFFTNDSSGGYVAGSDTWDKALELSAEDLEYYKTQANATSSKTSYTDIRDRVITSETEQDLDGYDLLRLSQQPQGSAKDFGRTQLTTNDEGETMQIIHDEQSGEVIIREISFGDDCYVDGRIITDGQSVSMYQRANRVNGQSCIDQSVIRMCNKGVLEGDNNFRYFYCNNIPKGSCIEGDTFIISGESVTRYSRVEVHPDDECANYMTTRACSDGSLSGAGYFKYKECSVGDIGDTCVINDQWFIRHNQSVTAYDEQDGSESFCEAHSQTRTCTDGFLDGSDAYQHRVCEPPYVDPDAVR